MIHSAVVRLTLFYLAIIMALSIGFSLVIYRISSEELTRTVKTPGVISFLDRQTVRTEFEDFRDMQLQESNRKLQQNLVLLNAGTLALGAIVSYALARRTLQPIEEAFEAQGRFTADASHELRTPLTAMQTSIEVGLRNPKLTLAGSKALLTSMLDEVKKLSSLSNGLLKLTRSDNGHFPKEPVVLQEVAAEAVAQLQLAAGNKDITVHNDVQAQQVLGDALSLKEALVILLDNAIKYSPSNTTMTVASRRQGKQVLLSVADHGQGIKAMDLEHIFDRFYRADSSRSRHQVEGYGLGLAIAQKIAEAHGGTITVQSSLGEGSTFTIKLPAVESAV